MEITAYTLPGCSSCVTLKQLFERAKVEYKEQKIRVDISSEQFNQDYPTVTAFPYVVIDGEPIGGLIDVARLFVEKGLVSSKKE
jgi:glutaredoxin